MAGIDITIQVLPGGIMPRYASTGAAGLDVHAAESLELAPMQRALVPTKLKMAIPAGYEVQIRPRSGLALKHGIGMVNSPGTIDSDYRGEIGVILINLGSEPFRIEAGDRIAQMIVSPVIQAKFIEVDILEVSARGEQGFGSTGHR